MSTPFTPIQTTLPDCLTGGKEAVIVATKDRHGQPLQTVISTSSGLVFTDPRPSSQEIARFYAEEYRQDYKSIPTPKMKHILRAGRLARARLNAIEPHLPKQARILDVGAGGGEFVYLAGQHGYQAAGIEPHKGYAEFAAREYKLDLKCGSFMDADYAPGMFDAVTLFHVLEHLEHPVEAIARLASFLKPNGFVVVEVPNVDFTRTAPNQKFHLAHLYNFNRQTLAAAGVKAGLHPVSVTAPGEEGILFALFQNRPSALLPDLRQVLAGSFERTLRILQGHSLLRHYAHPHVPISRLWQKMRRNADERAVSRKFDSPVELLNTLKT